MESVARKPSSLAVACLGAALACGLAAGPARSAAVAPWYDAVVAMVDAGQFARAEATLRLAETGAAASTALADLQFQRERMRRIRMDFGLDRDAAKARVQHWIADLRDDEFARWDAQGLLEHMDIDGERRYFNRAPSNLFRLSAEARARRRPDLPLPADGPYERLTPYHAAVVAAATRERREAVLPQRVEVTQSLVVKPDAVPAGETLRAWIPYPRPIPGQQEHLQWIGSTPGDARVAPEDALQRTAYMEATAVAGQPTRFEIRYALTVNARYTAVDPRRVQPAADDPALAPYLAEQPPHIRFTPALRAFSERVLQGETRPYEMTRLLFDAVDRIPWAGAREYSTISNLSEYALQAGHADCGQQTLLLITLLRMNGIPARWQSGMVFSDNATGYSNLHDWGAVYLAPYGWLPMDVTTGRLQSADPALRDFYLGGLDGYRIAFNDDVGPAFVPAKQHARSDTVDSQRGEAEWAGGNLYFDQWDYRFQWTVRPAGGSSSATP